MSTVLTYPQAELPLDVKRQVITILDSEWLSDSSVEERLHAPPP